MNTDEHINICVKNPREKQCRLFMSQTRIVLLTTQEYYRIHVILLNS